MLVYDIDCNDNLGFDDNVGFILLLVLVFIILLVLVFIMLLVLVIMLVYILIIMLISVFNFHLRFGYNVGYLMFWLY